MTNAEMWALLVGFFLPLAVSVVVQPRWPSHVKAIVTFLLCVVAAIGTVWTQDVDVGGQTLTKAILTVLVGAVTGYRGLWKPTGVAEAVESATSPPGQQAPP